MRPQSQALKRNPWARFKNALHRIRRPLKPKQLILFIGIALLFFGLAHYFSSNSKQMRLENERKVALLKEKKAEKERQHAMKELVIPKNPYRFYDELEERSFYSLAEEMEGGRAQETVLPKPQFSLISESDDPLDTLLAGDSNQSKIQSNNDSKQSEEEEDLIAPPMRAPIELLSAIEDEQGEEIEQGSSSFDVIAEPLISSRSTDTNRNASRKASQNESQAREPNFRKLQTGSFLSLAEANIQRKQLEAYGYNPQIIRAENRGKPIFRVHIGPFAINELESIKGDLKEKRFDFFEIR